MALLNLRCNDWNTEKDHKNCDLRLNRKSKVGEKMACTDSVGS